MNKKDGWIRTRSGRKINLFNPDPDSFLIEDIACALSKICRFGGNIDRFYSVAEHSHFVKLLSDYKGHSQMHDAPEFALNDMVSPLKKFMPMYRKVEDKMWEAICFRFGIKCSGRSYKDVKRADTRMLVTEQLQLYKHELYTKTRIKPANITIQCLEPKKAEELFLKGFYEIFPNWTGN